MQVQWFSHLRSKEEQDNFKNMVLGSKKVLDRAKEIVYNRIVGLNRNSSDDFENPNWALKEAFKKGQLSILDEIDKLVTISDNEIIN